jgi:hypothetical protein
LKQHAKHGQPVNNKNPASAGFLLAMLTNILLVMMVNLMTVTATAAAVAALVGAFVLIFRGFLRVCGHVRPSF